jgi:hypothetical protein
MRPFQSAANYTEIRYVVELQQKVNQTDLMRNTAGTARASIAYDTRSALHGNTTTTI